MVYKFRVTYDDHEDVYRDIEIKSSQSFMEFHNAIQQAIAFDNSKQATFYTSDDYWRREGVIASPNSNDSGKKIKSKNGEQQKKNVIADFVNNPHQKFIYVFDPDKEWIFLIELIKILPPTPETVYPVCSKTMGASPKQYKETSLPIPEDDEPDMKIEKDLPEEVIGIADEAIDEEEDVIIPLVPEVEDAAAIEDEASESEEEDGDADETDSGEEEKD